MWFSYSILTLLQADSDSIASGCTFISVVTLQNIWCTVFSHNCFQIPNWSTADDLFFQWPFMSVWLFVSLRVGDNQGVRLKKTGLPHSSPERLIVGNGIVRSPRFRSSRRKLLLFPGLEFISCMGEVEKLQGKPLSIREDWKVALVLPGRPKVQEVNVKSHSK